MALKSLNSKHFIIFLLPASDCVSMLEVYLKSPLFRFLCEPSLAIFILKLRLGQLEDAIIGENGRKK